MAEEAPAHQDRGMFGLVGKKKEDEGKQCDQAPPRTEGGRCEEGKKPGLVDKIKEKIPGHQEKLPGDGKQCCGQPGGEEEKKPGMFDKIKEKLPGQQNKNAVE
uniref:Dehydrin n=1 Tax=Pinus pinea TaxID=3346 RepID=A0A088MR77_PINPI|nr:dehydrin [Pinus pinea]AIN43964.1 dehydrin [Pinus pinea]